ncbi:MAG: hypothetical protein HZC28_00965 [Spirochaetes bacterium]|nr:hypothetical protein [Spirochaetota bacterium]
MPHGRIVRRTGRNICILALTLPLGLPLVSAVIEKKGSVIIMSNTAAEYQFDTRRNYLLSSVKRTGTKARAVTWQGFACVNNTNQWMRESATNFAVARIETNTARTSASLSVSMTNASARITRRYTLGTDADLSVSCEAIMDRTAPVSGYTEYFTLAETNTRLYYVERFLENDGFVTRMTAEIPPQSPAVSSPSEHLSPVFAVMERTGGIRFTSGGPYWFSVGHQKTTISGAFRFDRPETAFASSMTISPVEGTNECAAVYTHYTSSNRHASPTAAIAAVSGRVQAWWDVSTAKVFRCDPVPERKEPIMLSAAQGETESFTLVISTGFPLSMLIPKYTALTNGTNSIGPEQLSWSIVDSAIVGESMDGGWAGDVPDNLKKGRAFNCAPAIHQPLWITVRVPAATPAGVYHGGISIMSTKRTVIDIPLSVMVRLFAVTNRSTAAFFDTRSTQLDQYYGKSEGQVMRDRYADFCIDNRAAPSSPLYKTSLMWSGAAPITRYASNGVITNNIDFTEFDTAVDSYLTRTGYPFVLLNCFQIGYSRAIQNNRFGSKSEILTPVWTARATNFARALSLHLREKRWNSRVIFTLFEDPYPEHVKTVTDYAKLLRSIDADWRFMASGLYASALADVLSVISVPARAYNPAVMRPLREKGKATWVYAPPGYQLDAPGASVRLFYWWLWKEHIGAVMQGSINTWSELSTQDTADAHRSASWVLPNEAGPLSTLRFELTREGLEDNEYLHLLERLTAQAPAGAVKTNAERLLAEARALVPDVYTVNDFRNPDDRAAATHDLRNRIGDMIESLIAGSK